MSIEFLTNDDLIMQMIANGLVSGQPDGHLVYSGFFWGWPLSLLYRITGAVDWYSLAQLFFLILGSLIVLVKLTKRIERPVYRIPVFIISSFVWDVTLFRCFLQLQFTITAAFVGSVAVFYALLIDIHEDKSKWIRDLIIVSFLVLVSYNIRNMALLMLIPFAGAGWIGKWISEGFKDKKANIRFITLFACIIATLLLSEGVNRIYYSGEEWKEYLSFNKETENVFDYSGFSDYESNKEAYESIGMSAVDYEAIAYYDLQLLMEDINEKSLKTIYEMNPKREGLIPVGQILKNFIGRNLAYTDRPVNLLAYIIWIVAAVIAVVHLIKDKKKTLFVNLLLVFAARMALWIYLINAGRLPDRITWSLYIAEIMTLLALLINEKYERTGNLVLISGAVIIMAETLFIGFPKAVKIKGDNMAKNYYATSFEQLLDYAAEHPDNLYFLDANSLANVSRLKREHEGAAVAFLGGWLPGCPVEQEMLSAHGIEDPKNHLDVLNNKDAYFVFKDSEITNEEYLLSFYSQYTDVNSEEIDYLETDCGINFRIVKIYEDKP